jgi:uncharacterized protein (TIGR00251 family)
MKKEQAKAEAQILDVWVQPRASRNEIVGFQGDYLRIRVTAPPSEGEANLLLREVLADALDISRSQVEILSGHKARRKRVRVYGVPPANLKKLGRREET